MADIVIDGITYPSVEHYYQSKKAVDSQKEETIRNAISCNEAKKLGNSPELILHSDWGTRKISIMKKALEEKFTQHGELREILLSTGDAILMENSQEDYFWGIRADGAYTSPLSFDMRQKLPIKSG
jgi:ribA/ribD-fused uncharacterized protein